MTGEASPMGRSAQQDDRTELPVDQKLKKLSVLFSLLGSDPEQNIRIIVEQACQLLESTCSSFCYRDNQILPLVHWSIQNLPADFSPEAMADCSLSRQVIDQNDKVVIVNDLTLPQYADTVPQISKLGFKSFLGHPVNTKGKSIGALCLMDTRVRRFTDADAHIIATLAKALSLEQERKQAHDDLRRSEEIRAKALIESEKRYEDLYNNTPVMLYSVDQDDCVTSVSNLWLETMGYAREEVLGRSSLEFFTKDSRRAAVENILPSFYKSGQMKDRPFEFVTKRGEVKDVMLSAIAQRNEVGNYVGALAFMVDMTQAKVFIQDQKRLANRLQQAQKMEAIATLAGGIAHQFNNALAVILGNIELIQMDGLADQKLTRFIEPINQAGQKMVQLTSQLLAYARGGKFQTQVVPAHQFVKQALSLVSHSLASYVELKTDLDESTDAIEVDSTQMQMLLAAILSNASEAIDKKGSVTVKLKNVDLAPDDCIHYQGLKTGRHVLLRISDDGKGMNEDTRERIFEPFFTTKFQGRGLGMAAVYGIVKKHGGYTYVDSLLGDGTTVSIYLPSAAAPRKSVEKQAVHALKGSGTALIVEDEQLVMEVNRAIVEKLGYQVLEAKSGKEAIKIAETYSGIIDFALLDVILPDMSGNQIYPKLKKILPDLKVIVCSGFTLDGPAREILDAGAESFLPKPFTVAALSTALDEILNPPSIL